MGRFIESTHRFLQIIEKFLALVAGVLILVLMVIGVWEIIGRGAFEAPLHGGLDMVEQLMVAVAAFGIAYCQSALGNVRMTLLIGRMKGRLRWIFESFALFIAGTVIVVLIKGGWDNFLRAWELGGNTPEIGIPFWIGTFAVCAAMCLLLARILLQFLETLTLIGTPDAELITMKCIDAEHE